MSCRSLLSSPMQCSLRWQQVAARSTYASSMAFRVPGSSGSASLDIRQSDHILGHCDLIELPEDRWCPAKRIARSRSPGAVYTFRRRDFGARESGKSTLRPVWTSKRCVGLVPEHLQRLVLLSGFGVQSNARRVNDPRDRFMRARLSRSPSRTSNTLPSEAWLWLDGQVWLFSPWLEAVSSTCAS
jgi:hypothetical protein